MQTNVLRRLLTVSAFTLVAAACGGGGDDAPPPAAAPPPSSSIDTQVVRDWSSVMVEAFTRRDTANAGWLDSDESRIYAMAFAAAHDALNAIERRYQPYLTDTRNANADPRAALAAAIYTVAQATVPAEKPFLDDKYNTFIASVPSGAARDAGVALGQQTAQAILAARANDGANAAGTPVYSNNAPGEYRFTRCPQDAGKTNFDQCGPLKPNWRNVTPWAMTTNTQFRPGNPYNAAGTNQAEILANAVKTAQYTADFNEVKAKGVDGAANTRTDDESIVAMFWQEASHEAWNRVAVSIGQQRGLNAWDQTRMLALLHLALADTWISVYEAKYHFNMWRPVTAIHYADLDGNPATDLFSCPATNVFCWNRFGDATPATQEYPSAHAALGGAAERVIATLIGTDQVSFSLTTTQGPRATRKLTATEATRSYTSLSQAAQENAVSRVFIGFHFRVSTVAGLDQGRAISSFVIANRLKPV